VTLGLIARVKSAVLGKTLFIDHQCQGQQLAVRAFLFAASVFGLGISGRLSLKIGVGQVKQANALGQIKKLFFALGQMGFQGIFTLKQPVPGPVQRIKGSTQWHAGQLIKC